MPALQRPCRRLSGLGGATPLHFAASQGNTDAILALLDKGAAVDVKDSAFAQTPLMWAAETGSLYMVQDLLNHGAAVNLKDDDGDTALTLAQKRGFTKIVQLLISRGARTTAHAVARRRTV